MCETTSPTVPPAGMGAITFPENGNPGSGDLICGAGTAKRRKRRKPYTQKPANTIMSFDEFCDIQKKNETPD